MPEEPVGEGTHSVLGGPFGQSLTVWRAGMFGQ